MVVLVVRLVGCLDELFLFFFFQVACWIVFVFRSTTHSHTKNNFNKSVEKSETQCPSNCRRRVAVVVLRRVLRIQNHNQPTNQPLPIQVFSSIIVIVYLQNKTSFIFRFIFANQKLKSSLNWKK